MFKKLLTSIILTLVAFGGFFGDIVIHQPNSIQGNIAYAIGGCPGDELPDEFGNCKSGSINANDPAPNISKATIDQNKWYNQGIQLFNTLLGILTIIVTPAMALASWLLSPDWTSGDIFQLRGSMYKMWVVVSNMLYFVYAIILLMIAIGTIFGNEKFSYKVMLPRLALGILMVPFSWWFVQWTISLSSVVTASVMTIPYDTMVQKDNAFMNSKSIPKTYTVKSDHSEGSKTKVDCKTQQDKCISWNEFIQKGGGAYGSLLIYAYQVFSIDQITELRTQSGLDTTKSVVGALNQLIVGGIMFLIFGILVLALIAMLMIRAIKLWMYAIFSPLFTLHFVAGKDLLGDKMDSFNLKEFIGLCFIPAVVGLTLSFGLVIISAVSSAGTQVTGTGACTETLIIGEGCQIRGIAGDFMNNITRQVKKGSGGYQSITTMEIAGLSIVHEGKIDSKLNPSEAADGANTTSGVLASGGSIIGTLIIDIIALVFIWVAFMAAKGISKAVQVAVEPFEEMGKSIGKMAMSAPKYAPLPLPGGSVAGMQKAATSISNIPEQLADKRYKESELGKFITNLDPNQKLSEELQQKLNQAVAAGINTVEGIKKVLEVKAGASGQNNLTNSDIRKYTKMALEHKTQFSQAIDQSNYSSPIKTKLKDIINDDSLSVDEKDILISALLKGYDPTKLTSGKLKENIASAKHHLSNNAPGGTTGSSTTGQSGSSYTTTETTNKQAYVFNIEGKTFNVTKDFGDATKFNTGKATEIIKNSLKEDQFKGINIDAKKLKTMLDNFGRSDVQFTQVELDNLTKKESS